MEVVETIGIVEVVGLCWQFSDGVVPGRLSVRVQGNLEDSLQQSLEPRTMRHSITFSHRENRAIVRYANELRLAAYAADSTSAGGAAASSTSVAPVNKKEGAETSTQASAKASAAEKPNLVADICALETEVIGSAHESESIEQRLGAIEDKLFGQRSTEGLFVRLGNIKDALQNKTTLPTSRASAPAVAPAKAVRGTPASSTAESGSSGTASASTAASTEAATTAAPPATPETLPGATTTPAATAGAASPKPSATKGPPSKADQLYEAHKLFDDKNYKGARKLLEAFIAKNPLEYNGYYLLGLTDLKEHDSLPEYDQFAYNQFLKAYYLQPRSPDCKYVCEYVVRIINRDRRNDPRCVAVPSFFNGSPQSLLNVGVNCFLRDDDASATDLFDFVIKYRPGAAASAHYNLGAMAERKGQLQQALKEYKLAQSACQDRNALYSARMLKNDDIDLLSTALIVRRIQLVEHKIKTGDKVWSGNNQAKGTQLSARCTINRLSPTDVWADITDAGQRTNQ